MGSISVSTDTAQACEHLGEVIAFALDEAEEYMRVAEAHHKAIGGDVLNPNGANQRASLGECLLSHRVVAMLRQLAEMVPAPVGPPASQSTAVDVDGELEYLKFHAARWGGVQANDARMFPASAPPPACGACGDMDRAKCAVCGPAC